MLAGELQPGKPMACVRCGDLRGKIFSRKKAQKGKKS
jgi:hypothetical protein